RKGACDLHEAARSRARRFHRRGGFPRSLEAVAARGAAARRHHRRHRVPARGAPRAHRGIAAAHEGTQVSALAFKALRRLADGRFHSGEDMARAFGRSRASLSDALKQAPTLGIEVFSVRGKGYRLAEPIEFLDAAAIGARLRADDPRLSLEVVDEIDSTSTRLLELAAAGAPSGTCLAAEWQNSGRGRRGRAWISSVGGSLTFSLLWRFERGAGHLGGLSLACGAAVARALAECGVEHVQVKWPNDVVIAFRKLAGVLVETSGEMQGPSAAVIGVGVNYRLPERVLERIDQPVTDVAQSAAILPSRSVLLARMLASLAVAMDA